MHIAAHILVSVCYRFFGYFISKLFICLYLKLLYGCYPLYLFALLGIASLKRLSVRVPLVEMSALGACL